MLGIYNIFKFWQWETKLEWGQLMHGFIYMHWVDTIVLGKCEVHFTKKANIVFAIAHSN